jgi:hypothetical protein
MVENWQNDLLCYRAQYSTRVRIVRYEGDRCVAWWGSWRRSRTLQTWRSEMFVRGLDEGKLWIVKHLSTRHQHGLTFETTACFYLYYSYSMLCYPLHSHVDLGCMRMSPILAASSMKWMIFALHCLISETFFHQETLLQLSRCYLRLATTPVLWNDRVLDPSTGDRTDRLKPPSLGPRLKRDIMPILSVLESAQKSKVVCFISRMRKASQPICSAPSTQVVNLQDPVLGSTVNFKRSTNHSSYMRTAARMA